ncbi:ABC transporter ATP-binding protein [Roseibium aggregatum]|jgi:iron complex transport system ATP-binding protein|uniref:ABC transporter ATP-binding protein n=1 Tax=Roseibium aggregatum TaxID=187304 RepID=UPI001E475D76|nr:ABC transporter ATP-binding protein [Roseibium aggregatum]UES47977.1 ATP-binding cassette domain-containing protein [Roseibium aggregatum]
MGISVSNIYAGYQEPVLKDVSLSIKSGDLAVLIGPNGCGKSTLLKTIGRILTPDSGMIEVDGHDVTKANGRTVARTIAYLPQSPAVPSAVTVEQLVGYGRAPHQSLLGLRSKRDVELIDEAIAATRLDNLRHRRVSELSGGQRQRAFLAMALAQDTRYIMLDEPTTFLDVKYQFETLDLIAELNAAGRTAIVVLHDIAQAARYGRHMIVMRDGEIYAEGRPADIVTPELIWDVYRLDCDVYADPISGTPVATPRPKPEVRHNLESAAE